ncbi:MAG: alpha/beta fold hydrolase [Kordiimonadaceae bacterium]|nr:alpha/beta fold hydrolase [Kordiimonadaceae bacterium]
MKKILIAVPILLVAAMAYVFFFMPLVMITYARDAERGAAGLVEKSIQVGTHNISYLEGGEGETLLLLHGFAADKDNWVRFSKYLKSYRIIALDLPGWGESDYVEGETYGVANQVARLQEITKALGLKKYHVAGNSMGGWIAGALAHAAPEQVLSLGLFDAAGVTTPKKSEFLLALEKGENLLLTNSPEDFDRILDFVFVTPPEIPGSVKAYLAEKGTLRRSLNEKIGQELGTNLVALEPLLPDLQMPAFIIWGDTDRIIDISAIDVMKPLLKDPTVIVLEATGHAPMIEKPELSANHYAAFLHTISR